MGHTMSPTGVAALILLAFVVDWMSVGPNSFRDRLAFLLVVPAFREGFNGSPLDAWTVDALNRLVGGALSMADGAYVAGASANIVLSAAVGCLWIYTVGCLLPVKASKKLGRFATISWPQSAMFRLNTRLWICAALLGVFADLPRGVVGDLAEGSIIALTNVVAPLPAWLFGAA